MSPVRGPAPDLPMSQAPRPSRVHLRLPKRWPLLAVGVAVVFAAITGGALGYFLRLDLPDVQALEDYAPLWTAKPAEHQIMPWRY